MKNIGQLIREYRKRQGMTQQYLGEVIGKKGKSAQIYISHIETAKRAKYQESELIHLAEVLNIPKEKMENALECTLVQKTLSQKTAKHLRETLLRQTDIISLQQLMELEITSQRTWVVAVEGVFHQRYSLPLEFDLQSKIVQDTVFKSLSNGTSYRYLLERNPENISCYKKLLEMFTPAMQIGQGKIEKPLLQASFVADEFMGFAVMQLVIYLINNKTICYAINPIGANVSEDSVLCFRLREEITSKVEMSFQIAWHKGIDVLRKF
ncbi:helix-turn-helix domain-containing protein [Candidatus Uabimicrobium sp. HlEnr_7]|uniref:helix-turn-helix domain-containing protein n=1 Tax=Candidatus Uabimicrobium helgolandensis TaxID=3095367 RepID=UPI0035586C45